MGGLDLWLLAVSLSVIVTGVAIGLHAIGAADLTPVIGGLGSLLGALAAWGRRRALRAREASAAAADAVKDRSPNLVALAAGSLAALALLSACSSTSGQKWTERLKVYGSCLGRAALTCATEAFTPADLGVIFKASTVVDPDQATKDSPR